MGTVLAVDVGTSSARAQVFDETGQPAGQLAQERYSRERDAPRLVEVVRRAVAEALGEQRVDACGLSCFAHSLVALDERRRPLTPVLDWRDARSASQARELARRLGREELHERTGCYPHPSFWPAKLRWLTETDPEVFRTAHRFVTFGEVLLGAILGEDAPTGLSTASSTGLLDVHARAWDHEFLQTLDLDEARLPEIADDEIGSDPPWYPAVVDGVCSNVGAGCVGPSRAALMVGTSGALRLLYETDEPRPRRGLFLYVHPERRVAEGGAVSDGGNLHRWLDDTLAEQQSPALAERAPAGHGLTFLPLLGGERSPGWTTNATGAVTGLRLDTTADDLRQAAMEAVAFRFAEIADLLPEAREIVATGGALAADRDWVQILADALERPIEISAVDEASLRGAAVVALQRLGYEVEPPAVRGVVEPRPERFEALREARIRQSELYEQLTDE
ncbi:MAG TPA: gluconokinase [Gaiellaceae bacterium]